MADIKISLLPAGTPAVGTDIIPIVRDGGNYSVTAGSIAALGQQTVNGKAGSAITLTAADVGALASTYVPAWTQVTGKPTTFAPIIGTTSTTAKAGNYVPAWTEITGKPATFPPTIGTTVDTAKPGNYVPDWSEITNKPSVGSAAAWADITGKPSTFPSDWTTMSNKPTLLTIGTTALTAKAGNYVPDWSEITNKPATYPAAAPDWSAITGKPSVFPATPDAWSAITSVPAILTATAALTPAADRVVYYTSGTAAALMTVTSAARSVLDDTSVAAMRTTLGLGTVSTLNTVMVSNGGTGITAMDGDWVYKAGPANNMVRSRILETPTDWLLDTVNASLWTATSGTGVKYTWGDALTIAIGNGNALILNRTGGTTGNTLGFRYNGTEVGSVGINTNGAVFNTTSDRRLKENIVPAIAGLALANKLQVRSFDWKSDGEHVRYGVIAQEVDEVFPEAVSLSSGGQGAEPTYAVDYQRMVPLLLKAIQELTAKMEALEAANKE